ncbi:MAG: ribosomal protein S18-alanine N-acetyltransferase [Leptospiraceae bacterium]|nr:ribosomal protein S18-alanine N-acetyltransferase [Leptospiraceae bacterium]MCP5503502.1 ribosomal protein S18-alanine N-acetyltransferase [Leptospiraceae bacterium]
MLRIAGPGDLDSLVEVENKAFPSDRFTRRNFRYLLSKGNTLTFVFEEDKKVLAYGMLLFHSGTSLARLYSIAVVPEAQGKGIAKEMLKNLEAEARERDCISMRLEVRKDNAKAIEVYEKNGYKKFGSILEYYEDGMEALRYEKLLVPQLEQELVKVPYYEQTLDFTCGPASIMMAMNTIEPNLKLDRSLELKIWRESTTVFMTSGHGGCGPYGLALAAYRRGFDVEIYLKEKEPMFLDSVRNLEKKEVMKLVQEDFMEEIQKLPILVEYHTLSLEDIIQKFNEGGIPVVLISSYRIYREKFPHWVVITGYDDKYIYSHDPFVDYEKHKSPTDSINMPILKKEFQKMASYGKTGQKASIIIKKRGNNL